MSHNPKVHSRLRVVLLTAILTATSFITTAAPAPYAGPGPRGSAPMPFVITPQSALAAYCSTPNPSFTGRLTSATTGANAHTAVSDINNPNVYGYLSNVDEQWQCTLYRRYDGVAWNVDSTLGTFDWGTLLNSTSVNCNWAIGTDDYLKANDTADCPDTDDEYAMSMDLSDNSTYTTPNTFQPDQAHDTVGDFSFIHSDCDTTPYYGAKKVRYGQDFTNTNVSNRPGNNCDVRTLDPIDTTQTIHYDTTAPTASWTSPTGGPTKLSSYGVDLAWTESDNLTGIASRSVQRQKATLSGTSCLSDWANDGSAFSVGASPQADGNLLTGACYRWKLTLTDGAGNNSSTVTSGSIYRDTTSVLGADQQFTFESFDLGSGDSLAVNVVSGNLLATHPIVSLPIRGGSVGLALSYNSQDAGSIGEGSGWRLNVQRRLTINADNTVTFIDVAGGRHTFTSPSTVGTVTTYTRPATLYANLVKDTSQNPQWTLTFRDLSVDKFTTSGSEGLFSSSVDRFGNGYAIAYETGSSRVSTLTENGNSRAINFAWDGSGRLSSITDWAYISSGIVQTTNTGSRRQYRFFYDASSRLAGWSDPLNTSGACPTNASHLTCLSYTNGLLSAVNKTETYTTKSGSVLSSATQAATTEITFVGANVATVRDATQQAASGPSTTVTAVAGPGVQVVRPGTPASTTTYKLPTSSEMLGRVQSVFRRLGSTDIEQRTAWDSAQTIEPGSVTNNYGALLSTPARTVSYTYVSNSMGLVSRVTEPLDASNNRTTDYTYNANNDFTQMIVALNGSGTTRTITRYCYTSSGCSTSATGLTMLQQIDNYVDGTKGGSTGNSEDVTTDFAYDSYGQRTRRTRYNYDGSGNLLDSRQVGYTFDTKGNQTASIANYADGAVTGGDDLTPNTTTLARTDLTTAYTYDTAGNQVTVADPRRSIGLVNCSGSIRSTDYLDQSQYDPINQRVAEVSSTTIDVVLCTTTSGESRTATWTYDELGQVRSATDFGGLVSASQFDRTSHATSLYEDSPTTSAVQTAQNIYDASGRLIDNLNQLQIADSSLGKSHLAYDELGRTTTATDAFGTAEAVASSTSFDALDRQTAETVGDLPTTTTGYDLGGRAIDQDDAFTCTSTTYDYRDLATTAVAGQASGTCSGSGDHTTTNTYDGLGRLTQAEVTAGTGWHDKPTITTFDSAGNALYSASYVDLPAPGTTTSVDSAFNPLDQLVKATRSDGSISRSTYDAAGNETDSCYWASLPDDTCKPVGSTFTNPPTRLTSTGYDARSQRVSLQDAASNTTTAYDPDNNYQVSAVYLPTGTGKEHQSLFGYDERHRLVGITHQLCTISSGHSCSATTATGSDVYHYDNLDNRTEVNENNGNIGADLFYCYDAQNRLIYRNAGTACSSSANDETYVYGSGGNRKQTVINGITKNFTYSNGQLCKDGGTTCTTPNVFYDSNGRTSNWNGWWFWYDDQGRLTKACKSSICASTADKVEMTYDGDGHRTQLKTTPGGGSTATTNFRYDGNAVVEERDGANTLLRSYVVDQSGTIVKLIIPSGQTGTGTYMVTWNGHGDAMALWRIETSGSLTLANSYTYATWGTPTTTTHNSIADLGFRFLYSGAGLVQWDNAFGLGLYYMQARHFAPALGRFIQPDPTRQETNSYAYALNSPVTNADTSGCLASRVTTRFRPRSYEAAGLCGFAELRLGNVQQGLMMFYYYAWSISGPLRYFQMNATISNLTTGRTIALTGGGWNVVGTTFLRLTYVAIGRGIVRVTVFAVMLTGLLLWPSNICTSTSTDTILVTMGPGID